MFGRDREVARNRAGVTRKTSQQWTNRLQGILGDIGDAVVVTDLERRAIFLNAPAERLTGWKLEEAAGRPVDEIVCLRAEPKSNGAADSRAADPLDTALRECATGILPQGSMLDPRQGEPRNVTGSAAPVRDEAGEAVGAILVFRDVTERTEREQLVRAALTHAEHIFATVREPLVVLDRDLCVRSANRSFYKTFEVSREETEDRPLFALGNHQWDIPRLRDLLERVLPENETFDDFSVDHDFPGIGHRHMVLNARRLPPWGGQDAQILLAIEDLTPKKRAEEALRRNEKRLRKALSIDSIGVLFFERSSGILIDANETFLKESGYTRDDIESRRLTWRTMTPPEFVDVSLEQMRLLETSGRLGPYEKEYLRKDGSRWWMLFAGAKLDDETVIEYCINIDRLKEAESKLIQSERRYRRLFESARDGILILEADSGKIVDVNAYMTELLGGSRQYFLGKELWEIGLIGDKEESQRAFRELQRTEYIRYEHLPLEDVSGEKVDVEFVGNVYDVDGKRVIQCNIRDISERTLLKTLQEQARELADAGRRRDEFLAMLSHELRNPLAPLAAAVSLLRLHCDETPAQREARGVIERQVSHLTRLVDDLLEVSRITSGRIRLRRGRVLLSDVVDDAVEMVRPLVAQLDHRLTITTGAEPLWVHGDGARLGQVVSNLLTNAVKYTDRGGRISLSIMREADEAVLRVEDDGVGIEPDLLPYVFDIFCQAEQPLSRSHGGLGVGLAIVRTLVEMHGGRVEVHSRGRGEGSEFVVRLPLTQPDDRESREDPVAGADSAAPAATLRVLVVDDNPDTSRTYDLLISAMGHAVRTAACGREALKIAEACGPDVVFLDIGLPEMDGHEVSRRIRKMDFANDPVLVAVTGYGLEQDREQSRAAGFDHHLVKPANMDEIAGILDTTAKRKASRAGPKPSGQPDEPPGEGQ